MGLEAVNFMKFDELLVIDNVIVLATVTPASVPRIPPLFDINQRSLKDQVGMWKHPREIDQLVK